MMTTDSSSLGSDLNIAAQVIEAPHEPQDGFEAIASSEVVGTEVTILDAVLQHVPDGGEHGAATARMAFFAPRRLRRRRNWACKYSFLTRTAAQAAVTRAVFSQGEPLRVRVGQAGSDTWHD